MTMTYRAAWVKRTSASTRYASSLVWKYWAAFQERRDRQKLRSALSDLSDRGLMDIGTARGEIDYVVSNQGIDPRGIRTDYPLIWRQLGGGNWKRTHSERGLDFRYGSCRRR
jgi:uncharacterized protein YjiS (DUF1127 family)